MTQPDPNPSRLWAFISASLLFFVGCAALVGIWAAGLKNHDAWLLDVGATQYIRDRYIGFIAYWTLLGTLGVAALTGSLSVLGRALPSFGRAATRSRNALMALPDSIWVTLLSVLCVTGGVLTRIYLLQNAPLTDDESAYRFMAELIAQGRLTADSMPVPLKLFFDRIFMINDGELYAQYFIGWPALQAPGVWLGTAEYMNAFYSGLVIPPLYFAARRLTSPAAARIVTLLYLSAPFTLIAAGTEMSHTTCLMALTYCLWFALRCHDSDAHPGNWAAVAFFFGLAFLIRALTALGLGLPILVFALWPLIKQPRALAARRLLAFALPATLLAGGFFWVNEVQNEDPLTVSYVKVREYERENEHRFGRPAQKQGEVSAFDAREPHVALGRTAMAALRLLVASLGWPCLLLVLLLAAGGRARLLWTLVASFFAAHFFVRDAGIDTFGPVHFFEVMLPLLLLVGVAFARIPSLTRRLLPDAPAGFGTLMSGGSLLIILAASLAIYYPIRFEAVERVAGATNTIIDLVEDTVETPAIVFAPKPFTHRCQTKPAISFVWWRPNNSPNYDDDILWVNHISVRDNQRFMSYFPDRRGYVLYRMRGCRYGVDPLETVSRQRARRWPIGGSNRGPRWQDAPPPPEPANPSALDPGSPP